MPKLKKDKPPYFGEREENAVYNYINSHSVEERHKIYSEILRKPFKIMVSSILRRYHIHLGNYDIMEVEMNGLSHLVENFVKFKKYIIEFKTKDDDTDKWYKHKNFKFSTEEKMLEKYEDLINYNDEYEYRPAIAKAYSYCQTIVRNYFKDHSKTSRKEIITNLNYEDYSEEVENHPEYVYEMKEHDHKDELDELIEVIIVKIKEDLDTNSELRNNDIKVGEAILNVLENWHQLFMEDNIYTADDKYSNNFRRNKIILLLKEQTNLSTKEIRLAMKNFKSLYFINKQLFFNEKNKL